MSWPPGNVVLSPQAFEDLRREVRQLKLELTNTRRRLALFGVRRHQGGFMPAKVTAWLGKADAPGIAIDASGTVSIWTGSPPADSGDDLTSCLNWTGVAIDSGGRVKVLEIDGDKFVFPLECDE